MVYFVRIGEGGPIKIGYSENPEVRLYNLGLYYRQSLELLLSIPGDRKTERAMHERFAHLRIEKTEQFQPGADLMLFIGSPPGEPRKPLEAVEPSPRETENPDLPKPRRDPWAPRKTRETTDTKAVAEELAREMRRGGWSFREIGEVLNRSGSWAQGVVSGRSQAKAKEALAVGTLIADS